MLSLRVRIYLGKPLDRPNPSHERSYNTPSGTFDSREGSELPAFFLERRMDAEDRSATNPYRRHRQGHVGTSTKRVIRGNGNHLQRGRH